MGNDNASIGKGMMFFCARTKKLFLNTRTKPKKRKTITTQMRFVKKNDRKPYFCHDGVFDWAFFCVCFLDYPDGWGGEYPMEKPLALISQKNGKNELILLLFVVVVVEICFFRVV